MHDIVSIFTQGYERLCSTYAINTRLEINAVTQKFIAYALTFDNLLKELQVRNC